MNGLYVGDGKPRLHSSLPKGECNMTNAEIILELIEVRERLQQGWCQGAFHRRTWLGKDTYCLVGAIAPSFCIMVEFTPVLVALSDVAMNYVVQPLTYGRRQDDLILWNDQKGRTQQEVLDLVDRTIASLMQVEAAAVAETRELVEA